MPDSRDESGRDEAGRFKAGFVTNPGGRRRMPEEVRDMLKAASPKAAKALVDALDATKAVVVSDGAAVGSHVEYVVDHDMRVKAANAVFDRLYGKPVQAITGDEGAPLFGDTTGLLDAMRKVVDGGK